MEPNLAIIAASMLAIPQSFDRLYQSSNRRGVEGDKGNGEPTYVDGKQEKDAGLEIVVRQELVAAFHSTGHELDSGSESPVPQELAVNEVK